MNTTRWVCRGLLPLAVLPLAGCTLIGFGIGAIVDNSSRGKAKPVPPVSLVSVDKGKSIELSLRDGSVVAGRFQGLEAVPEAVYRERWKQSLQALAPGTLLPGLGPVRVRTRAGVEADVTLIGLKPGRLSIREGRSAAPGTMSLDSLATLAVPGGGSLDGATLARLAQEGRLPFLEALVVTSGDVRRAVPLEDVRGASVTTKNAKKVGAIVGAAIDAGIVAAVLISAARQPPAPPPCTGDYCISCPLVYSDGARGLELDAEPLGASLFAADEATDHARLGRIEARDGAYRIQIRNQMRELEHLDAVRLQVVDHPAGVEIVPGMGRALHAIREPVAPSRAVDATGANLAPLLAREDGRSWVELPLGRDPELPSSRRATAMLEFPRPPGRAAAVLVISLRSTDWGTALFAHVLGLHGPGQAAFWARLEADPIERGTLRTAWAREALPRVQVLTRGGWRDTGTLAHIPRLVTGRRALPLDLRDVEGDVLQVRIDALPGLWAFDQVSVDYAAPHAPEARVLLPHTALTADGRDVRELLSASDDRRVTLASMSGRVDVVFDAPAPTAGSTRSVLIEVEGYYRPLLPASGEEQAELYERLVHEPGALARYALTGADAETRRLAQHAP